MGLLDLFRKTETKEAPSVKVVDIGGALVNYDLSFEVYYKYYELNPFVQAVINRRSNDVWSKGFVLTKWATKLYNDDFEKFIETSTTKTSREFIKKLVRDYDITWNCYVYIVRNKSQVPIWLQILDPRYINPVANKYGELLGYIQNLNGINVLSKTDVFHLKSDADLKNEVLWKSRMTSLFLDIESDQEARDSNLAFFKNNQTPSSLIIVDKDFDMSTNVTAFAEMQSKLKQMFEGGKFKGGKNKHRSLLAQGVSWVLKVQDKISDMEFMELRKFTLEVTSAVYEVPKAMLWFTEAVNYSNGSMQYEMYWDNIEGMETTFSEFLTRILKVFDEKYEFVFLKDNLRKLITKSAIVKTLYSEAWVITLNEAREILQYASVDGWEKFSEKEVKKEEKAKKEEE